MVNDDDDDDDDDGAERRGCCYYDWDCGCGLNHDLVFYVCAHGAEWSGAVRPQVRPCLDDAAAAASDGVSLPSPVAAAVETPVAPPNILVSHRKAQWSCGSFYCA
eukprot:CAMPEP_0175014520 /NCGR_PEP_ID=MMETSP0005-20121125/10593_1 /TAXON_ID=420556 /ORGANISM="Ochromonas sp., Strain CCMP1393" /LENGTH=104 /DNA_ID=CAMNT_0016271243 /DNA_START=154 /DNA_END=468 /DNA_ORIENTATION=+